MYFLVGLVREFLDVVAVDFGPLEEFLVEDEVFFEEVSVDVFDGRAVHVEVVGVDLSSAFINHVESGFDAGGGLGADAYASGRGDGEQGDVAAAVANHVGVEFFVGFFDTEDERVVAFLGAAIDGECAAFFRHGDRGAVGGESQMFVDFGGEGVAVVGAVADTEGGEHVAFSGDAQPGTTSLEGLFSDFQPQVTFHAFHIVRFGVAVDFGEDLVHLFKFEVDDVVHQSLGVMDVLLEEGHVEGGFVRERVFNVAVKVNGYQTAAVVRAKRDFAAGVGGDSEEAFIGVAVGDGFAVDGVPEEDARFRGFPRVVDDFVPQLAGVYLLNNFRILGMDGVLLGIGCSVFDAVHEFVVDFDGDIGAGHFSLDHFGVDEFFSVGVFD